MVKQNIALLNVDGRTHCRWCAPKEITRLLNRREIRAIRERGKPVRYALVSYPNPSNSEMSAAQITAAEMRQLPAMTEKQLKAIARECRNASAEPSIVARVKLIQRWIGHGLIERNAVTELIAQA